MTLNRLGFALCAARFSLPCNHAIRCMRVGRVVLLKVNYDDEDAFVPACR